MTERTVQAPHPGLRAIILSSDDGALIASKVARANVDARIVDRVTVTTGPCVSARHIQIPIDASVPEILLAARATQRPLQVELSDRERTILDMYVDGESVTDIAEHLDLGFESVRTYLRRARQKLTDAGHVASTRDDLRDLLGDVAR